MCQQIIHLPIYVNVPTEPRPRGQRISAEGTAAVTRTNHLEVCHGITAQTSSTLSVHSINSHTAINQQRLTVRVARTAW
jgi:hypothetical protein